jgi:hypothetical protein
LRFGGASTAFSEQIIRNRNFARLTKRAIYGKIAARL